jgi:hypothetical protein
MKSHSRRNTLRLDVPTVELDGSFLAMGNSSRGKSNENTIVERLDGGGRFSQALEGRPSGVGLGVSRKWVERRRVG